MRLKQGKDFFIMWNGSALNSAASDLVDLTFGVLAKGVPVSEPYFGDVMAVFQDQYTGLSAVKIESCQINVVLVGWLDFKFFSGLYAGVCLGRPLFLASPSLLPATL
jgi:hypothetical protein